MIKSTFNDDKRSHHSALIKLDARLICDSLKSCLINTQKLMVHSVFEHACNLQTEQQQLITFQTYDMPIAPRSCILPCIDLRLLFNQHQIIWLKDKDQLYFDSYQIDLTTARPVNLQLKHPITLNQITKLNTILTKLLPDSAPENGIYHILQGRSLMFPLVVLANIQLAINNLAEWLSGTELTTEDLTACLIQIVGFGIGLTPSADDFLVGILLVLDSLNHPLRAQLITALTPLLSRTTDISHAMLDNAMQGRYGAHLLALFTSTSTLHHAIEQVTDYGHSSGHDMLCGISFALKNLNPTR